MPDSWNRVCLPLEVESISLHRETAWEARMRRERKRERRRRRRLERGRRWWQARGAREAGDG